MEDISIRKTDGRQPVASTH